MIEFGKVLLNPQSISSIQVLDFNHLDRGIEIVVKMNNGDKFSMQDCEQWFVDMFTNAVAEALSPSRDES